MHMRTAQLAVGALALLVCSACIFSRYSRRDRFVETVLLSTHKLSQPLQQRLLGKPAPDKPKAAVELPPGATLVLKISLPNTYKGYCEALAVHLPKSAQHEADYQVWVSGKAAGPWTPVGRAVSTHRFDIDDIPFAKAGYVKLRVSPSSGHSLWLDALHIRVHLPGWLPLLQRAPPQQSPLVRKRSLARADRSIQEGLALFEQQAYKKALPKLHEALLWRPRHARLAYGIAATYHALAQHYQAIRHYRRAFRLAPPNKEQREEFGESYHAMRQLPLALVAFQRCIAAAPLYPRCYYHRIASASLYNRKKKLLLSMYKDQNRLATQRTHISRRTWPMKRFMAYAMKRRRPLTITRAPEKLPLHAHLDWFLFLQRLFPQDKAAALEQSLKGLWRYNRAHPADRGRMLLYKGMFYYKAGKKKAGLKALKKAEQAKKGKQKQVVKALREGLSLEEKGKHSAARQVYRAANAKHPHPLLQQYLERLP